MTTRTLTPLELFHGTLARNVPSIVREGLLPRLKVYEKRVSPDVACRLAEEANFAGHEHRVFATSSRKHASFYARLRDIQAPEIAIVCISNPVRAGFILDADVNREDGLDEWVTQGSVSAEYISRIEIYKTGGSRGWFVPDDQCMPRPDAVLTQAELLQIFVRHYDSWSPTPTLPR